ncbi:MAG TPA: Ig-like domain-containing protein, partial [Anaeromyxobacteraceae bacterium]|nr:Ig-like domain-containing protein [Anaeromyxobacteraceae bacterium]
TAAGLPLANGTSISVQARAAPAAGGAAPATQADEALVGRLAVFADALLTGNVRFFAPCATVHAHAASLAAGDVVRYALTWRDPSGAVVRTVSPWATTARGTADDSLVLPAGAAPGTWTLALTDGGATIEEISFTVERAGAFTALATDRARYQAGNPLAVTAAWRSETTSAPLSGTLVRYVVEDQAGGAYLDLAGAFHPAPGTTRTLTGVTLASGESATDGFAVGAAAFPAAGRYQVRAEWQLQCGATPLLAGAVAPFDVAPSAPAVTQPTSGALLGTRTPTLAGTADPGASVTLSDGSRSYGPVTAGAGGAFAYTLAAGEALADGWYAFSATQAVNGVTSDASAPVSFTIDATAPDAPVLDAVASPTRSEPVAVSGSAEAGSTVRLSVDGALAATAGAAGGAFSASLTGVAEGPHQLTAAATDAAGNQGPESAPVAFTVDRTAPAIPSLDAFPAPVAADPVPVSGRTEAGASVEVFLDGGGSPAATATADGVGSFAVFLAGLAEGSHQVTARAADAAGNQSGTSSPLSFQVDRIPPAPPVLAPVASPTAADPVPVSGTAEPGATVTLFLDGGASPAASAQADGAGAFSAALAVAVDGTHQIAAIAADAAGNLGPFSNPVAFTVDRTAPASPALTSPAAGATVASGAVTVSGTAEPGSTVSVSLDGGAPVTVLAAGDGSFGVEVSAGQGSHTLSVTATDPAGNTSAPASRS